MRARHNVGFIGGTEEQRADIKTLFSVHTKLRLTDSISERVVIYAFAENYVVASRSEDGQKVIVRRGPGFAQRLMAVVNDLNVRKRGPKCKNVRSAVLSKERAA